MDINELKSFSDEFVKIAFGWGNQDPDNWQNQPITNAISGAIGGGAGAYLGGGRGAAIPIVAAGGALGGYLGGAYRKSRLQAEQQQKGGKRKTASFLGNRQ